MTHSAFLWWQKTSPTTTDAAAAAAVPAATCSISPAKVAAMNSSASSCGGLSRLIKKLKRRSKMMLCTPGSRQPAFQCRYDPLSYSLNFDAAGGRSPADEDDYYFKFCAFSSRFAAIPTNIGCRQSCSQVLIAA